MKPPLLSKKTYKTTFKNLHKRCTNNIITETVPSIDTPVSEIKKSTVHRYILSLTKKVLKVNKKNCHWMHKFVRANRVFRTSVVDMIYVKDTRMWSHKTSCKYLLRAIKCYRFDCTRDPWLKRSNVTALPRSILIAPLSYRQTIML